MFTLALLVRSLANDSSCGCRIFLRDSGATKSSSASVNEGATKGLHFLALGSMFDSFSVSTRHGMLNSGLLQWCLWTLGWKRPIVRLTKFVASSTHASSPTSKVRLFLMLLACLLESLQQISLSVFQFPQPLQFSLVYWTNPLWFWLSDFDFEMNPLHIILLSKTSPIIVCQKNY